MRARLLSLAVVPVVAMWATGAAPVRQPLDAVHLRLQLDEQGEVIQAVVTPEDGLTIDIDGVGSYRIVPSILAAAKVRLRVYTGERGTQGEDGEAAEDIEVTVGETVRLESIPSAQVTILDIVDTTTAATDQDGELLTTVSWADGSCPTPTTPPLQPASVSDDGGGECCVTCGFVTACGCKVSMSCGSCCTPPCC